MSKSIIAYSVMNNLQNRFRKDIISSLQKELALKNIMAVPFLSKIVVNMGVKDALSDKKNIEKSAEVLAQITGQKAKVTKAKKAISGFKLREGDLIGLMVTLRGKRMYDFFEKLVNIVLPRLKDFSGVRRESFDGKGNYTLGLSESAVFPEIDIGKVDTIQGLEISIITTAKDNSKGYELLKALGMPFRK